MQPGAKCLLRPEPVQRPERVQKAILHSVLGVLMGRRNCPRNGVRTPFVQSDEPRERLAIAALRRQDQLALPCASLSLTRRLRL
jgi:hypothetical protein